LTEACEQASRLVLILDELPICAREIERSDPGAGSTFLHSLRRLRYDNEPKLTMLCLGSIGFHHVVPHLGGAINDLEKHPLMPLAEPFADELAARLLHSTPIPAVTREGLAPALARASEGVPYYLHHLADGCDRRHAAGRMLSPEVPGEILDEAITSSDDPWDLKHYVTRLPAYYGDEAPFAGALLDVIAVQPCDLGALRDALDSDPRDFSGYELGGILSRLEQDHYLQLQQSGTHRFRSDIVRRAWLRWRR